MPPSTKYLTIAVDCVTSLRSKWETPPPPLPNEANQQFCNSHNMITYTEHTQQSTYTPTVQLTDHTEPESH